MTNYIKRVKRQNRYSESLKRKIGKEYLAGKASYAILAEEHGLRSKDVVKEFVKWYRKQLSKEASPMNSQDKTEKEDQSNISLQEVQRLREQLALSELKVEMLETIIEEAEKMLSIDIKKKYGTDQSK